MEKVSFRELGQVAYESYTDVLRSGKGESTNFPEQLTWDNLHPIAQTAWKMAAMTVLLEYGESKRNALV